MQAERDKFVRAGQDESARAVQGGFSLPEVLLAMALGAVLIMTAASLLPGMSASLDLLQTRLRLQQNAHAVGLLLERAHARGNFTGCLQDRSFAGTALRHHYSAASEADWGRDSLLHARTKQRVPGTGAMALSYAEPPAISVALPSSQKNALRLASKPQDYKTGDFLLLTDCTRGALVQPDKLSYSAGEYLLDGVAPSRVAGWSAPVYAYLWVEMGYMIRYTLRTDARGNRVPALYLVRSNRSAWEVVEDISALDFHADAQKVQVSVGAGSEDARQFWAVQLL